MKPQELISELISKTEDHISRVENFLPVDMLVLNKKICESWSILECFEHLNLYFEYYLLEISNAIEKSTSNSSESFKPGLIGNYFANSMIPKENFKKMKSPKDKNPSHIVLKKDSIDKLLKNLNILIELLEKSKKTDLGKVKIPVSIAKLLKIKLGDTFRFIIYHNERHLQQAERLLQ